VLDFLIYWHGIPLAAALALLSAYIYVSSPRTLTPIFDDSYISATFARNLAEYGKLTFDGVTWSTGATSPFHVAIMAVLIKAGMDPITSGIAVGIASHALLAIGVYLLAFALFRTRLAALLAAAAIAFTPYAALDAGNGLETSLFMALVAFSSAFLFMWKTPTGRLVTGILLALSILTRPEGAFLLAAAVVYRWVDRAEGETLMEFARDAVLLAAPGVLVFGAMQAYSLAVSDIVGGTANAKLKFFQEDTRPFQEKFYVASDDVGIFAGPILTLIALGALAIRRRETLLPVLFLTPILCLYTLLFAGGLLHYFFRYQHPVLPYIAAFAGGGTAYLLSVAAKGDFVVKILVVAGLVVAVVPLWQHYERWRGLYTDAANETHDLVEAMGMDLNTIVQPADVLATHDIGAVGYFGKFQVLDLVGLVNPKVIPFHNGRHIKEYMEGARPNYLLMFPEWDVDFLWLNPSADPEKYELVKVYPGGTLRTSPYILYRLHYK
jgi:hypothetical protein